MLLIKNGNILTMEDTNFKNGYVIVNNGKIFDVGTMDEFKENNSFDSIIDAKGKYVLPGFIDAHCHVGMWEDSLGFEGDDGNEDTDPISPQLRAIDALNPFDTSFVEARQAGITTVVTGPGSANVIGGQFAAIKTYGKRIDKMIIKNPVAMKVAFGENPKTVYNDKDETPVTRMATAALLREILYKANNYYDSLSKFKENPDENDKPEYDFKLESLLPVLKKEIPLKAHAHRADDIFTALRIAKEFNIDITIEHCTEGHLIVDELAEDPVPVMVGPALTDRSKIELKNLTFKTASVLSEAGLSVAIVTDHPATPIQYLPLCASLACKHGMDEYEALKSITINAAKNCRIDDLVGSLKTGKDADIIIYEGHPFDYKSEIKQVMINGITVHGL